MLRARRVHVVRPDGMLPIAIAMQGMSPWALLLVSSWLADSLSRLPVLAEACWSLRK
jgi:hypothetical protein